MWPVGAAGRRRLLIRSRPKSHDHQVPALLGHDVAGLEVSVDDPLVVGLPERQGRLANDGGGLGCGEGLVSRALGEGCPRCRAWSKSGFRRSRRRRGSGRGWGGRGWRRRGPRARTAGRPGDRRRGQGREGDLAIELGVVGQVDGPHSPLAELLHDPIAAELLGKVGPGMARTEPFQAEASLDIAEAAPPSGRARAKRRARTSCGSLAEGLFLDVGVMAAVRVGAGSTRTGIGGDSLRVGSAFRVQA